LDKKFHIPLYWKCQLTGWTVAALYWEYHAMTGGHFIWLLGVLHFLGDIVICISLTHLYRNFALKHRFQNLGLTPLLKRIIPAALLLGIAYTFIILIKLYLFLVWFEPQLAISFRDFYNTNAQTVFIGGVRLMSIWLLAYHMYQYAQREIRADKEYARLEIITREVQLNNLTAQLNPHFLFNSLNNIKALVLENPASARRAIDLLSELLRNNLYSGDIKLVALKDELSLVNDYLELEKLRFEERLKFTIDVVEDMPAIFIPRLSIQTLVENAIKHGIAKLKAGGLITIKAEQVVNGVKLTVQNPGDLNMPEAENGVGLKNLKERLILQYGDKASFDISGRLQETVLATMIIPFT